MRVGNSGRSCHEAPEPSFAQNSSKLFFQRQALPRRFCPHADNDRIAAIRTSYSLQRRNYRQ